MKKLVGRLTASVDNEEGSSYAQIIELIKEKKCSLVSNNVYANSGQAGIIDKKLTCGKWEAKLTKAMDEEVHHLIQSRKAELGPLTSHAEIKQLMDEANVCIVQQQLPLDYQDSLTELWKKIGKTH